MKQLFGLTLLALILAALPAQAQLIKITRGGGNGQMPVGPWYLYWPLEAHFQTPASQQYPYWPAPMTLPLPQSAGQGMGGYNPYAAPGQMQAQAPAMNGYNTYAGNPGMGGYNPYGMMPPQGGYNPYGGINPYQAAPTYPASGGANNSAPTLRTDR